MPEIPVFSHQIKDFGLNRPEDFRLSLDKEQVVKIASLNCLELLGQGAYSAVFALGQEKAFAIDKSGQFARNVGMAQLEYYYQRILQTIYPEHFPKIYASYSFLANGQGGVSRGGSIRERIHYDIGQQQQFDPLTSFEKDFVKAKKDEPRDHMDFLTVSGWRVPKFVPKTIVKKMLEWQDNGIPLVFDHGKEEHFRVDAQGRIMYLDTPFIMKGDEAKWNPALVRQFMRKKGFCAATINSTERIIKRVIHLEERENLIGWLGKKLMYEEERTVETILQGNFDQWLKQFCVQYSLEYKPMDEGDLKYIKLQIGINRFMFQ